ncbi:MAG: L-seryl-tRNA(Sec) selenium transferase [Pseudomonadota bacterium]
MTRNTDFRALPGVDKMLEHVRLKPLIHVHGHSLVTHALRKSIESARNQLKAGKPLPDECRIIEDALDFLSAITTSSLKSVINATGVIIHTNLGRAPIGRAVLDDIADILTGYSNLEFDLKAGRRGKRNAHVSEIIEYLTGAEGSLVVNNNAAAIILTLNTLAKDKEVIISRGELIEIGDSFRIPDIMRAAGVNMVEVGTTNRTRLSDYENAITPNTALIFKAHQSNYSIQGFTEEACVEDLAQLAHSKGLSFIYDIGSGLLRRPENIDMKEEPDIRSALAGGADLVTFSCDKLLGGPQAGIIAGSGQLIAKLSKAPMMRALRVGKITLAALCAACRNYLSDETLVKANPLFTMLERKEDDLKEIAERFAGELKKAGVDCRVVESFGQCGGGSLPDLKMKSYAVELVTESSESSESVFQKLLKLDKPVIGVLRKGKLLFDVFTIFRDDMSYLVSSITSVFGNVIASDSEAIS